MAEYHLYFLHLDGGIEGRTEFMAADDEAAWRIASVLAAYSFDQHHGWMLWQGVRRLFETGQIDGDASFSAADATQLTDAERQALQGCAEALLISPWRVGKSARLRAALAELHGPDTTAAPESRAQPEPRNSAAKSDFG